MTPIGSTSAGASGVIDLIVAAGDRSYQQSDWTLALGFYRNAVAMNPMAAAAQALPLAIGHCEIELAAPRALESLVLDAPALADSERLQIFVSRVRFRARRLCQAGDFARAARLLRFLATYDPPIAATYVRSIDAGPTGREAAPRAERGDPAFLAAEGLTAAHIDAMRRWASGRRLLLVFRRHFFDMPSRCHEPVDTVGRAAERFGFVVRHVNSHIVAPDGDRAAFPAVLDAAIRSFRPDLIVYDELFGSGISAGNDDVADEIASVLARARQDLGTKVVNNFLDVWRIPTPLVFRGLDSCVDLIAHCHPAAIGCGSAAENRAVFCYMHPLGLPAPTVPAASHAKACFVGSIYESSIARLVWWAETARRGLALDFLETDHTAADRSDLEFANLFHAYQLSVNFTRRPTGVTILTARTLQTLLAGGALLEEESSDSAYFLKRGEHYLSFETLDDLAGLIERLLGDPERCARMAEAGHDWATKYFTGDYFWAGMMRRLIG